MNETIEKLGTIDVYVHMTAVFTTCHGTGFLTRVTRWAALVELVFQRVSGVVQSLIVLTAPDCPL